MSVIPSKIIPSTMGRYAGPYKVWDVDGRRTHSYRAVRFKTVDGDETKVVIDPDYIEGSGDSAWYRCDGFSFGEVTYKRGSATKRLCYPSNSLVGSYSSGGLQVNYNWSALNWSAADSRWYGTDMQWGAGINDIPVTDQLTTSKIQDGSAEISFYQVAPLIYTVQHDSLVFVRLNEVSNVFDRVSVFFRPVSEFPGVNIYRGLFSEWVSIGAFTELFTGRGDNQFCMQIPCKAGAQFAFFRDIIRPGVDSTVQIKANVYNSDGTSTTERHISVVGRNSANNNSLTLMLYRDAAATTPGFTPVDFYIGNTQLADYRESVTNFRPANECVTIHELPLVV